MKCKSKQVLVTRRTVVGGLVGMAASKLSIGMAESRVILKSVIVPFSAGGSSDVFGRKLALLLSSASNSPVIVENITGASGVIAVNQLLHRPRDGATLLLGNSGLICNTSLLMKGQVEFDPQVDLVPICTVTDHPFLLLSGRDFPANNLEELRQVFIRDNEQLTYATPEVGSANHIAGEVILQRLGLKGTNIPYRNLSQGVIDVVQGRVHLGIFSWQNIRTFMESDKAKVLCILSETPLELLPQIKTVATQGFGKFDIVGWNALFVANGTPQSIIRELETVIRSIFAKDEINQFIKGTGIVPAFRGHEDSRLFVNNEIRRYRELLERYKLI